jgi:hypothetical protein
MMLHLQLRLVQPAGIDAPRERRPTALGSSYYCQGYVAVLIMLPMTEYRCLADWKACESAWTGLT